MNLQIEKAIMLARQAHKGQTRKDSDIPYFRHVANVATTVEKHVPPHSALATDAICTAYLHDVLEDTTTTYQDIVTATSQRVAEYVEELTEYPNPQLNRAHRKAIRNAKLAKASYVARLVKLADLFDNMSAPTIEDKDFMHLYKQECSELLDTIAFTHPQLANKVRKAIDTER